MTVLLENLDILGFGKTKFVMDRGFYSGDNSNGLYREHIKFLVGVKLSLKVIRKNLDDVYDDIRMFDNFDEGISIYGLMSLLSGNLPRKGLTKEMSSKINAGSTSIITIA